MKHDLEMQINLKEPERQGTMFPGFSVLMLWGQAVFFLFLEGFSYSQELKITDCKL